MNRVQFPPKAPGETLTLSADFASFLGIGETLASATSTMSVYGGTDANPSAMLVGTPTIVVSPGGELQTTVQQKVTGGILGNIYLLTLNATSSAGQTISLEGFVSISQGPL